MTATAADTRKRRALELAIENAFFLPGSAAQIAFAFSTDAKKLHASDVHRIWGAAKNAGRLPDIIRPAGGPKPDDRDVKREALAP